MVHFPDYYLNPAAFLIDFSKQTVVAAVHLAQGLVNHNQHVKNIDIAVTFAVWCSRGIPAVWWYPVGHISITCLARRRGLQTQNDVKAFQNVQYVHYTVTAIRISTYAAHAILGINSRS